jgi:hypothetical protein
MDETPNERSHTPSDSPGWRESFYFGFFDEASGIGAYSSMGEKPHSGRSGYICTLWGDDVIAETRIGAMERTATEHACAGLRYRLDESDGSWAIAYRGTMPILGPTGEAYVGSVAVDESLPPVDVAMDLRFEPLTPAYFYDGSHPAWERLFDGHVEQSGRIAGVVTVGDERYRIDALGARDHSWGTRDWGHPRGWTFFTASFDRGPAFVSLWAADTAAGSAVDGYVSRNGVTARITGLEADIAGERPRPGTPFGLSIVDDTGETTELVCRPHSSMRHQVGGGRSAPASHVDRWLVEIDSPIHGIGHGDFELLDPASTHENPAEEHR